MNIIKEINFSHTVYWQSPDLKSVEEATIICINEKHGDELNTYANCTLINNLVSRCGISATDVLVVVEANKEAQIDHHCQTQYLKFPIKRVGWDNPLSEEMKQAWALIAKIKNCLEKFGSLTKDIQTRQLGPAQLLAIGAEFKTLQSELKDLLKEAYADQQDSINDENCFELAKKYIASRYEEDYLKTFPERNSSIIETLEKASHSAKLIILIAGTTHLIQSANNDKLLSVESVYNYLKNKKAVILKYKD
jgi:hypothetical protein